MPEAEIPPSARAALERIVARNLGAAHREIMRRPNHLHDGLVVFVLATYGYQATAGLIELLYPDEIASGTLVLSDPGNDHVRIEVRSRLVSLD